VLASGEEQRDFGSEGLSTWREILDRHSKIRSEKIVDLFDRGLRLLEIKNNQIPDLREINKRLAALSGFKGVFVSGLEDGERFFSMLSRREFPIGNFLRSKDDLSYTPEPDLIHDLYGHLPFFADKAYGDFCQEFGKLACEFLDRKDLLRQFERFFWFTVEFGLIKTPSGVRVFGAGIASSIGECEYALSGVPEVLPFDVDSIRHQEFRIDEMQKRLFVIENVEQLYASLPVLYARVSDDRYDKFSTKQKEQIR
jgi:phenylalanine-4-hydroxylase